MQPETKTSRGTIDITVHEVEDSGDVKEIHAASGGGWGGTLVNKAFENLIRDIVGKRVYDKFVLAETEDWLDLTRDFEIKKKEIGQTIRSRETIKIPVSLINLLRKETKQELEERVKSCRYSDRITLSSDKLRIDGTIMTALFDHSVSKTIEHIKTLLRQRPVRNINAILMVGGFSDSPILQKAVKMEFKHLKVIIPREAASTVLRGAVILGQNPASIKGRILKYTYGYEINSPFEEGTHPESKKITTDHGVRCKNAYIVYARRGGRVVFGHEAQMRIIKPSNSTQTKVGIDIYVTQSVSTPVVVDESLTKIGQLTVNLDEHDGNIHREILFSMDFGSTLIQASAMDKKTGKSFTTSLNFLG